MMQTIRLTDRVTWCGVLDKDLRTFDIVMRTEFGTTYNSYIVRGDSASALIDASKEAFSDEWLGKVSSIISASKIDYLIVNHTEPDHSGAIARFAELNPDVRIMATSGAIGFLKEIVNRPVGALAVKDGQTLDLGGVTLKFMTLPNLHWPDTMFTYAVEEKALFTCDCFGSHYAFDDMLASKITAVDDYKAATENYFVNILGPFKKPFLANAMKKVRAMDIAMICPGHGPILDTPETIERIYGWYDEWMKEAPKAGKKKAVIAYVTAYGYTKMLAERIAAGITDTGADVECFDLTGHPELSDPALNAIASSDGFLLGTPTIVGEALKPIWDLATSMFAVTHKGKVAGAFGSYGWTGEGVPNITERLKQLKLKVQDGFRVRFRPTDADLLDAYDYGYDFGCVMAGKENDRKAKAQGGRKLVKCLVCGEIFDSSVSVCPVCGAGKEQLVEVAGSGSEFTSDKEQIITIIGGGQAAFAAAKAARERSKAAHIIMISREEHLPYYRPMLTKTMLAGFTADQLSIEPENWYEENDILPLLGRDVASIDTKAKTITLGDGAVFAYDKLIYALGAESFVPPITGLFVKDGLRSGASVIRTVDDALKIKDMIANGAKNAVVIGGGVLGLEAAWELRRSGLGVTVLETAPRLMQRQIDVPASDIIISAAKKSGVEIVTGAKIAAVYGDTAADLKKLGASIINSLLDANVIKGGDEAESPVRGVVLEDGRYYPCDLLVISTGVRANISLAQAAGIECGRGVTVDDHMRTSAPDVYACGDCAELGGVNYALWSQASGEGMTAGANAVGDDVTYRPEGGPVSFSGFDTSLYAVGDNGSDPKKSFRTIESRDDSRGIYEKFYFSGGHLVGVIDIGGKPKLAEIGRALGSGASVSEAASLLG